MPTGEHTAWGHPSERADLRRGHDTPPTCIFHCVSEITWDDFAKVDIRVGRIVQADEFPKARKPAYKLRIDFGELGVKTSSAQITRHYRAEDLPGRLVLAVVNFPPRQIADFRSEVLTLGVVLGDGDVVLVHPERAVPPGTRIA